MDEVGSEDRRGRLGGAFPAEMLGQREAWSGQVLSLDFK